MTSKSIWDTMDSIALQPKNMENTVKFIQCLKELCDNDLEILIRCLYYPGEPSNQAHHVYLELDGRRYYLCYTSEAKAKKDKRAGDWNIAKARAILDNIYNRKEAGGIVFNTDDKSMVIIPIGILKMMMPGMQGC